MLPLRPINLRDVGETEKDTPNLGLLPFGGALAQDRRNLAFDRPTARPFKCFFHRNKGAFFCVLIRSLVPRLDTNYTDYGRSRGDRHRQLRSGK